MCSRSTLAAPMPRASGRTSGWEARVKVVVPGGTGQIGAIPGPWLSAAGHEVVTLTRRPTGEGQVSWDGQSLGAWAGAIDGSDVVINLAGRSVSCRYNKASDTSLSAAAGRP